MFRIPFFIGASVITTAVVTSAAWLRQAHRTWGIVAADVGRTLPGDEIIPEPSTVETRSLVIDAPAARVWPWLVQMGYERGGWYSYDKLDMKGTSATEIMPELQDLAVGDLVPTHPEGGFVAKVVDPQKALVLFMDSDTVAGPEQATAADDQADAVEGDDIPSGLKAAGMVGEMTMPVFEGTWAFVLEPETDARTRLIERFRIRSDEEGFAQRVGMPLMGYAVFAMTRKQMLGIKERAEAYATVDAPSPAPVPAAEELQPAGA